MATSFSRFPGERVDLLTRANGELEEKLEEKLKADAKTEHKLLISLSTEINFQGAHLVKALITYSDNLILQDSCSKYLEFIKLSLDVLNTQSSDAFNRLRKVRDSILIAHPLSNNGQNHKAPVIIGYLKPFDDFIAALEAIVITRLSYALSYADIKRAKIDYKFFHKKLSDQLNSFKELRNTAPALFHLNEALTPICNTGEQALALLDRLVKGPSEYNKEHLEDYIHFLRLSSQALSQGQKIDDSKSGGHALPHEQRSFVGLNADGRIVDVDREAANKIIMPQQACDELQILTAKINSRLKPIDATKLSNFCRAIKEAPWRILFAMGFAISLAFASPAVLLALQVCTTIASISAFYKIGSRYCLFSSLPTIGSFNTQVNNTQATLNKEWRSPTKKAN